MSTAAPRPLVTTRRRPAAAGGELAGGPLPITLAAHGAQLTLALGGVATATWDAGDLPLFATAHRAGSGAPLRLTGAHEGADFATTLIWLPAPQAWHWTLDWECTVDCAPRLRLARPTVRGAAPRPAPDAAPRPAAPLAGAALPPDGQLLWHADKGPSTWTALRWQADLWPEAITADPWGVTVRFPAARRLVASLVICTGTTPVAPTRRAALAGRLLARAVAAVANAPAPSPTA